MQSWYGRLWSLRNKRLTSLLGQDLPGMIATCRVMLYVGRMHLQLSTFCAPRVTLHHERADAALPEEAKQAERLQRGKVG